MQPYLDAVRKASLPAIWGQGVKLAREKSVTRASQNDASAGREVTLRVRAPGGGFEHEARLVAHLPAIGRTLLLSPGVIGKRDQRRERDAKDRGENARSNE